MKRTIRLTESELINIVKKVINEQQKKVVAIDGIDVQINNDEKGTILINGKKIKLSHTLGDIKVRDIKKLDKNNYQVTGYSGNSQKIDYSDIKKIIDFAYSTKIQDSIGSLLNKLTMEKIK